LLVLVIVVWQLATLLAHNLYFPTPWSILDAARQLWLSGPPDHLFLTDKVSADVLPSIGRLLLGWLIAGTVGVIFGVLLGRSRMALAYLHPVLSFVRAVPPPMAVPVFLVVFGIGTPMEVATITVGVLWPILLNTIDGARSIDTTVHETAQAFRTSRTRWLFTVVVPASAPKIFAGLRIAMSLALVMMVISELAGSTDGLGFQMTLSEGRFDLPSMWAVIVLLGVLGFVFNATLLVIERRILGWHWQAKLTHTT
jgi:ABC-type nitrate/sulfonate/bicarbonate transport system permease component